VLLPTCWPWAVAGSRRSQQPRLHHGTLGQGSGFKTWHADRRNKKHAPCPGVLTHQISPCNRSINSLATAKP
jgi:hypothetical protein